METGGYVEADPADDCFMAARDARFLLEQLAWLDGKDLFEEFMDEE